VESTPGAAEWPIFRERSYEAALRGVVRKSQSLDVL
jgi:hypothetical protein